MRERERGIEKERDGEGEWEIHRQTGGQTYRDWRVGVCKERERQRDREIERERDIET